MLKKDIEYLTQKSLLMKEYAENLLEKSLKTSIWKHFFVKYIKALKCNFFDPAKISLHNHNLLSGFP